MPGGEPAHKQGFLLALSMLLGPESALSRKRHAFLSPSLHFCPLLLLLLSRFSRVRLCATP